jgi:hypothetical protein
MRKMCVIKKKCIQGLSVIGVFCFLGLTSLAQENSDIQRLEKKIDSVLMLLQKDAVQVQSHQDTIKMDCTEEIKTLSSNHAQTLNKVKVELEQAKQDITKLQKEKTEQQDNIAQFQAQNKKQIETMLDQMLAGGTAMDMEGINHFLELAKQHKAANLQKMEVFVVVFKEVIQLEQAFNEMREYEQVKSTAEVLKFKVAAYPGLQKEVLNILFKLENYCDYEQRLLDVIALSQTQSSDENRKKQLLRREDSFNNYPSLKAEIEKVKANQDYTVIPKCNK